MTTISQNEFEQLGANLSAAVLASLRTRNPKYIKQLEESLTEHIDPNTTVARTQALLKGTDLSDWTPLLEAYFELDWRLRKIAYAARMLCSPPSDVVLSAYGLSSGAWIHYHLDQWIVTLSSLLECGETLVKRVIRQLVRGNDRQWKTHEKRMVDNTLQPLRATVDDVRNMTAHTRGTGIEGMTKDQLWGPYLLLPDIDLLEARDQAAIQFHQRWCAMVRETSTQAIAVVFAVAQELNTLAFQGTNTNAPDQQI